MARIQCIATNEKLVAEARVENNAVRQNIRYRMLMRSEIRSVRFLAGCPGNRIR